MPAKKKATKEQLREAILRGMNYAQIAGKFGYASEMSARSAVWLQGLNGLYRQMKPKRERRKAAIQEQMEDTGKKDTVRDIGRQSKDVPLFATNNGKVVIDNLHLVLGDDFKPYLPAKFGKVG